MEQRSLEKMETAPVRKLMLSMGLPVILSMMLQALYNIVDSAFIARMENGEDALHALTLAFPVQMLMVAFAIGTGVGVNVTLAKSLGQKDGEKASRVAGNSIFLGLVLTAAFILFGIFGVRPYIASQTVHADVCEMGVSYLRICCFCPAGVIFFGIFEKLLQATGLTVHSTVAQITGALLNIALDPLLIFGLLGFPALGAAGAALATVIGQLASFLLALLFHFTANKSISKRVACICPRASLLKEIYAVGLPAIIAQALMSVMTYGVNLIFGQTNEALVTAYGLYYKIQQFVLFAAFGLRDTITPIVSFGYGMRNKKRMQDGIRYGVGYTLVIMAVGTLVLVLFARPICLAFGLSEATEALCISATRIISSAFLFAGISIALQGVFQALNCGLSSLLVSVCRQLLFVLPVVWLLTQWIAADLHNAWLAWLTFPIAEIATALIAVWLLRKAYAEKIRS